MPNESEEVLPERITLSELKPAAGQEVHLLGVPSPLSWQVDGTDSVVVDIPDSLRQSPPCAHAFVLKFSRTVKQKR
jgi:hypothetical protein